MPHKLACRFCTRDHANLLSIILILVLCAAEVTVTPFSGQCSHSPLCTLLNGGAEYGVKLFEGCRLETVRRDPLALSPCHHYPGGDHRSIIIKTRILHRRWDAILVFALCREHVNNISSQISGSASR